MDPIQLVQLVLKWAEKGNIFVLARYSTVGQ